MLFRKVILSVLILLAAFAIAAPNAGAFDVKATGGDDSYSDKVSWHGYYEFEYWNKDGQNKYFDAHKIVVWMGVQINPIAFLTTEVEYEHFPRLPGDEVGGNGEIKVDSANLKLTPVENFSVLAGIFYAPFGIEYYSYPGHKNKLVSRPELMKGGKVIPGTWSDVGLQIEKIFPGIGQIDFYYTNGDPHNGGVSRDNKSGGNNAKMFGARLMLNKMIEGINVGASYASGKYDENEEFNASRIGAHLNVDLAKITGAVMAPVFLAEYVTGTDESDSSVTGEDRDMSGFYAQLSSAVHPAVELVARYSVYDNDTEATDNKKTNTAIGVIFHAGEHLQIKAEHQIKDEEGDAVDNNFTVFQIVADW